MNIEQVPWKLLSSQGPTYYKGACAPVAVVLHRSQGYYSTARQWAIEGHYGASWHYSIDHDGSIMQHLTHADGGYHAGIAATAPTPTWSGWQGHGRNVNAYCVTPETRILTPDLRWVHAGDLREGDGILGFDEYGTGEGRRRRMKDAQVAHAAFRKRPVYRIKLANGEVLHSTGEHKWLVRGTNPNSHTHIQWVTTLDLANTLRHPYRTHPPEMPRYFPVTEPVDTYAAGFLAAAFDGEGHLTKHVGGQVFHLGYSQKDNAMALSVHRYLKEMGFDYRVAEQSGGRRVFTSTLRGGRENVYTFLMQMRPPRLIDRWLAMDKQDFALSAREHVAVESVEFDGEREIAELSSTSLTYIAEGYAAHNTLGVEMMGFAGDPHEPEQLASLKWLCQRLARECGFAFTRENFPAHAEIDVVNRVNDFNTPEIREEVYKYLFEEEAMTPAFRRLQTIAWGVGEVEDAHLFQAYDALVAAGFIDGAPVGGDALNQFEVRRYRIAGLSVSDVADAAYQVVGGS